MFKLWSESGKLFFLLAIFVFRPLNGTEILQKSRNVVSCNRDNRVLLKEKGTNLRPYGPFDKVYGEDTSQIAVYKDVVAPLITHVLNGYNCTVFA